MGAAATQICGLRSEKKGMNNTRVPVSLIHDETRWVAEEIFEKWGRRGAGGEMHPSSRQGSPSSRGRTRQAASVTFHRGDARRKKKNFTFAGGTQSDGKVTSSRSPFPNQTLRPWGGLGGTLAQWRGRPVPTKYDDTRRPSPDARRRIESRRPGTCVGEVSNDPSRAPAGGARLSGII